MKNDFLSRKRLALCEEGFAEGGAIVIAPDDLHKANTSGGEPYEIEVTLLC